MVALSAADATRRTLAAPLAAHGADEGCRPCQSRPHTAEAAEAVEVVAPVEGATRAADAMTQAHGQQDMQQQQALPTVGTMDWRVLARAYEMAETMAEARARA